MQKLLSLIRSHLFIFVFFFSITLGDDLEKVLLWFMSSVLLFLLEFYSILSYI